MPSAQVIDLTPNPRTESTPLEKTLSGFSKRNRENQIDQQETDALKDIYGQYQKDGQNLEKAIMSVQTKQGLSPTTRVNTIKQLMDFQKHNGELQKKAQLDAEKNEKKSQQDVIAKDLQQKLGLTTEQGQAYAANPGLLNKAYPKESKGNQADRPVDAEQQRNIDAVVNTDHFKNANISQKQQLLTRGGVSTPNQKIILDSYEAQKKVDLEDKNFQYNVHKDTKDYDTTIEKEAKAAQHQLDAIKDVEKSIGNVKPTDLANIFRQFGDAGKAVSNAILTKDQAKIQASIPAFLEGRKELFGVRLSDADLALLSDKLPDMGKSEQANRQILTMMKRYSKLAIAKQKVAHQIKKKNKGLRSINYSDEVEETFDEMKKPIKVINPDNGKVISIPSFELQDALLGGATLYNE